MLSPVGMPHKPEDWDPHQKIANRMDTKKKKLGAKLLFYLWENNYTPFGPLRASGKWGASKFLNFYLTKRMGLSDGEEKEELKAYLH